MKEEGGRLKEIVSERNWKRKFDRSKFRAFQRIYCDSAVNGGSIVQNSKTGAVVTVEVPKFILEAEPRPKLESASGLKPHWTPSFSVRRGMLGLVVAAAIFNLLASPVLRLWESSWVSGNWIEYLILPVVVGVLTGEMGAMACWLVLGEGPFLRRLGVHWGIGLVLGLSYTASFLSAWVFDDNFLVNFRDGIAWVLMYGLLMPACMLPAISLAAQLPFWPLRTHLGWRVEPAGMNGQAERAQPLSILDILAGTAVVAVSLGLVRALPSVAAWDIWFQIAVMALAIIGIGVIVFLPGMIFVLRTRNAGVGTGMFFGYVILLMSGIIGVAAAITNDMPRGEEVFAMLFGSIVFAATVGSPLFVWRACGYRLVWPRDRKRESVAIDDVK